jgi:hypothetical protein
VAAVRGALFIVILTAVVLLLWQRIGGSWNTFNRGGVLPASVVTGFSEANQGRTISYRGKDGRTALELLELAADVSTERHSPLVVTSIDGRTPDEYQRWTFSVDGFVQSVPPDEYMTRNGQTVTWTIVDDSTAD